MQSGYLKSQNTIDALYSKYLFSGSSIAVALESLPQKITATKYRPGGHVISGASSYSTIIVSSAARRLNNWKAPGPDGIHNFWSKHYLLGWLYRYKMLLIGEVPNWLTLGRTVHVLIMKTDNLDLKW